MLSRDLFMSKQSGESIISVIVEMDITYFLPLIDLLNRLNVTDTQLSWGSLPFYNKDIQTYWLHRNG